MLGLYFPAEQFVHEAEPLYAYVPTGHVKQVVLDVAPTVDEYVPFEQLVHEAEPGVLEYVPAKQVVHEVDPSVEYVPAEHV